DQIGPVSRTVLDAALLQEVIGGHDPRDSTSLPDPVGNLVEAARNGNVAGMRIGVIKELQGEGYEAGVLARFQESLEL
ncbi:amidase family protein, partial [Leifsonia sp. SIMBA_070]